MDKNKNVTDDTTALEDMPQTGGDVVAQQDQETIGQAGGRAAQEQQQEQQESQEFEQNQQSEEKGNKPSESEDLWGQE